MHFVISESRCENHLIQLLFFLNIRICTETKSETFRFKMIVQPSLPPTPAVPLPVTSSLAQNGGLGGGVAQFFMQDVLGTDHRDTFSLLVK